MELLYGILLISSILAIVSIATSLISFRYGAPLLLLFLVVGLLAGSTGIAGEQFSDPQTVFVIGCIALATILFESGFTTQWRSYRLAAWPALTMATFGVLITAGIVMVTGVYVLDLGWLEAAFLGAVLSSTDAAAVFFLLRVGRITIRDRVRSTLEIESGTNDPMAIMLTLVLVEIATILTATGEAITPTYAEIFGHFVKELFIGSIVGYVGGRVIVLVINKLNFESSLYPLISLVIALFVFALSGKLEGSGFLAIYIAGLTAGNSRLRNSQNVRRFHEGISWLSQLTMFLVLGMMADLGRLITMALPALGIAAVLIFVARPLATFLCLSPYKFTPAETSFVGWVGLRGAVSILLALLPLMAHVENAEIVFSVTFLVVVYSLLVQGWTIKKVAQTLNLIVPPHTGPVRRMEFELPTGSNLELVAYNVHPDSLIARGAPLPAWSHAVLVLRDGRPLALYDDPWKLQENDQVYFFTDPSRLPVFDRLLGAPLKDYESERKFYGDIVLEPTVKFSELTGIYGLRIDGVNQDLTLAELFELEFKKSYEVGDRLRISRFELIVRAIEENKIKSIGLALMAPDLRDQIIGHGSPARRFIRKIRSMLLASRIHSSDDS
ncbi:MAG: potassium/proton antiporter [Alphaproteobacteria bacterium]|nr:potassium/proton antiporter [Alphaproteobacteria bacterium]